ncbi:MAG: 50S ribosomal protein L21 [Pseudomonadota bacterium]
MFAVIKTGGKQYRVAADDILKVEKIAGESGDMVEFSQVLMVGNGDKTTVGSPLVEGAMVTAELVELGRGRKVISFKKRRRQNSRRTKGHRQWLTTVRISEILTDGAKPTKKAAKKKPEPAKAAPAKAETAAKAETKAPAAEKPAEKAKPAAKPEPKAEAKPAKAKSEAAKPAKEKKAAKPAAAEAKEKTLFTAPKGKGDDLTKVKGIGPVAMKQLNEQGLTTFAQLAKLTAADIKRIDEAMPFSAEQISDWRDQAKKLAS